MRRSTDKKYGNASYLPGTTAVKITSGIFSRLRVPIRFTFLCLRVMLPVGPHAPLKDLIWVKATPAF